MPTNDPRQSKSQRRDEAREKARALRIEQERKAKRNKIIAGTTIGVLVVALVGAVVFTFMNKADTQAQYRDVAFAGSASGEVQAPAISDVKLPKTADQETGGVPVSDEGVGVTGDDDVVVSVFFDFMCPYCGLFDQANAADLTTLAAEDGVTVLYRPVSFLDHMSRDTHYSTRAMNALGVVADEDPEHVQAFITALYANQPKENTKGLSDDEIAKIATDLGVPAAVAAKFTDTVDGTFKVGDKEESGTWRVFAPWAAASTGQMAKETQVGTPKIFIDGKEWPGDGDSQLLYTQGALKQAVEDAVAAKG